jgi:hypothetical protein
MPIGTSQSATTFRLTLSRACACLTARFMMEMEQPQRAGAERLGLGLEPPIDVVRRQVAQSTGSQRLTDVQISQPSIVGDGGLDPTGAPNPVSLPTLG